MRLTPCLMFMSKGGDYTSVCTFLGLYSEYLNNLCVI